MNAEPQPSNKMQYMNQLELNNESPLLDDLKKNTMYIKHIKQVTSNDYTPDNDALYLRPYRSVSGKFVEKYKRVSDIDKLSSPHISRNY